MIFFRQWQIKDFVNEKIDIEDIHKNCYIIENKLGIIGIVNIKNNIINIIHCEIDYYIAFIKIIEEFLFMKYSVIIMLKKPLINITDHGWYQKKDWYEKCKPIIKDRRYELEVLDIGKKYD